MESNTAGFTTNIDWHSKVLDPWKVTQLDLQLT